MKKTLWLRDKGYPRSLRVLRHLDDIRNRRRVTRAERLARKPPGYVPRAKPEHRPTPATPRRRALRSLCTTASIMSQKALDAMQNQRSNLMARRTAPGRHYTDPLCNDFKLIARHDRDLARFRQALAEATAA